MTTHTDTPQRGKMVPTSDVNTKHDTSIVSGLDSPSTSRLEVLSNYEGEDKIISFAEIANKIQNSPEELSMLSGWSEFDSLIKGFRPQQLVVVSALTKSGKTQWCMDLTSKMKEYNPIWLPFEESAEELIRKYLERGMEPPHGFTPQVMKGGELDWIENRIIEAISKYNSKMVFIDQLDFIVPLGADNHALRVGEAMRRLKGIAKKWNVCIFIICHLVKAKMETTPTLEDLKGSSSIAQEADTVILLWREAKREKGQMVVTNNTIVSVQANRRHGTTGYVTMVFEDNQFREREWRDSEIAEKDFNEW